MTTMVEMMMQEIKQMDLPIFRVTLVGAPHKTGYDAHVEFRSWYSLSGMSTHEDTPEGAIKMLRDVVAKHASKACPACGVVSEREGAEEPR